MSINFDVQFDGINVIVTSELDMSDEEIMSVHGELWEIEDCFDELRTNNKCIENG